MQKGKENSRMADKKWIARLSTLVIFATPFLSSTALASTHTMPGNFNWTGVYAGGFVGGATGSRITTTEPLRLDNNAFWFRPFHNSFSFKTKPSFIGGATIGYNWQCGLAPFVIGLEGEYSYLNLHRRHGDPNQFPYANLPDNNLQNNSHNVVNIGKSIGYGLIGARVGYVKHCVLFYLKSGIIFTRVQSKYYSVKTEDRALAYLDLAGSKRLTGYGVGGGIEFAFPFARCSNFSTKIEYLFLGINKTQKVYGHCSCNFLWRTIERIRGVNTVKLGINYKFR